MAVWLIVNPNAGAGRAAAIARDLVDLLKATGIQPTVHVCANGDEPAAVASTAAAAGARLVVGVGGDGLVAAVAEGILAAQPPLDNGTARADGTALAVVATGSANDYARALGVRQISLLEHIALLGDDEARARVDVVRVETEGGVRHILNVGGTGFDAIVAQRAANMTRLRGAPRYVAAMLVELPRFHAAQFELAVDATRHDTAAMMVAVANGSTYGGGMRVAPGAHLQSGELAVCVIGRLSRVEFLRAFPRVFRGTHTTHPAVTMLRGREVRIASDRPMAILGDGELIGTLPATFRVLPGALTVVAPKTAPLA